MRRPCESSACFTVKEHGQTVIIEGAFNSGISDIAMDTIESWIKFRDDIKSGMYDHIGTVREASVDQWYSRGMEWPQT